MFAVRNGVAAAGPGPAINRPKAVAERIATCWTPPPRAADAAGEATLRLQFSRSGGVIGTPKVTYVKPGLENALREAFVASINAALSRCAPLQFTPAFGAAIAGYPFAIRFIASGAD